MNPITLHLVLSNAYAGERPLTAARIKHAALPPGTTLIAAGGTPELLAVQITVPGGDDRTDAALTGLGLYLSALEVHLEDSGVLCLHASIGEPDGTLTNILHPAPTGVIADNLRHLGLIEQA